jgi:hypothetical protein
VDLFVFPAIDRIISIMTSRNRHGAAPGLNFNRAGEHPRIADAQVWEEEQCA